MHTAEYELKYLETASQQLEKYLLSDVLYWPVGISQPEGLPPYPRLTIGGILLAELHADVTCQNNNEKSRLIYIKAEIENVRSSWGVFWDKKGVREFNSRMNLWKNFLEDYQENPSSQFDRYAYETRHRVQLELLQEDISINRNSLELLAVLDKKLLSFFRSGNFIWEKDLMNAYPPGPYWFLYGNLPEFKTGTEFK
ncbi:MAG: hypothetical protein ACK2TU_03845 [Anaerolineales bacterium]